MGFLSSLFGYDDKPKVTTKVASIPPELKPYVDEALKDTQALYKQRMGEGYTPYTGDTIAGLTPEQIASQEGLKSLVGTQVPFQQEALGMFRQGAERFTPEIAKEFMSPYQRAVIDQEKEQAQRQYERTKRPEFEADAVRAGGMSGLGSRAAIESAEREDLQARFLGDIETRGLQAAYKDAQDQFTNQKARERTMASDVATAGGNIFSAGIAEQGLLQDIGTEKQGLAQSALDEAYFKYKKEKEFPEEQLARYTSSIYGNPVMEQPNFTQTGTPAQASMGKSLIGLGMSGLKAYGKGGGFSSGGFSMDNLFGKGAAGGQVGGLTTLYRKTGGDLMDEDVEFQTAKNRSRKDTDAANAAAAALNITAPTVSPPPPEPAVDPNEAQRKTIAESIREIRGAPIDSIMAGLGAYLKPFGTPADIPGAMTAADRAAQVDAAKEELKQSAVETKADADLAKARLKARKDKAAKFSNVMSLRNQAFKDAFPTAEMTVTEDGSFILSGGAVYRLLRNRKNPKTNKNYTIPESENLAEVLRQGSSQIYEQALELASEKYYTPAQIQRYLGNALGKFRRENLNLR
tara:strand:- start:5087 stop:6811 length:1725 start_codon:yes stop_codon:yes gene_type:complete